MFAGDHQPFGEVTYGQMKQKFNSLVIIYVVGRKKSDAFNLTVKYGCGSIMLLVLKNRLLHFRK